ncbi:M20/M25/M40 family metallo-hydrolase [Halobacteriovorax sp. JY17]|uniref:M20/M25/M40 family metallo-hydrolase n=1 Tax=Halobacteriovorax sp. JY17 TaxID=2014617 RepID=UPI000C63806A|nr:M20/M25/M40 family metallo-hydrolase [Halobacteriovorax sp. JY17]PIK13929.1 MAG: leucyl aminopeptidase [Halobacteriovorax sp. JY17]
MKNSLKWISLSLLLSASVNAAPSKKLITIDNDAVNFTNKSFAQKSMTIKTVEGISLLEIDEDAIAELSHEMHDKFHRCGGFMVHDSIEEALESLNATEVRNFAKSAPFADYSITEEETVRDLIAQVSEKNITEVITKLSSYKNRYYKSQSGVDAVHWIKDRWASLVAHRNDARVELYEHSSWDQPSVILTIDGSSDETIIIGGHADSIAGFWGRATARAPGADDNASGIATITEVIRVLAGSAYKPTKTIKFMGYAAEEVGLLGSKAIAKSMKQKNANIIGVLQLDMTNFKGSDLDIVMMTDYTNQQQNEFIGTLLDKYLPEVGWGYDRCGYGCSDHASWHGEGYPASMPFESKKNDMNHNIHTARDTIEQSRGGSLHAVKFAKLALSYAVELDR